MHLFFSSLSLRSKRSLRQSDPHLTAVIGVSSLKTTDFGQLEFQPSNAPEVLQTPAMEGGEGVVDKQKKDIDRPVVQGFDVQGQGGTLGGSNEEGDYCRICRGEATDELPLFYPCKCSGSIKFVHQDCLMEWLSHSQKKYCELCKTPFRFTKLYDHQMPQTLPLPLFLRQICLHGVQNIIRWIRYLMVSLVWLGWLPWSIRQVWRGLFWLADGSWGSVAHMDGNTSSTRLRDLTSSTDLNTTTDVFSSNVTADLLSALPQIAAPISGFLGYSSGDFLLVKLVRVFYPNLLKWSANLISTGSSNSTALPTIPERQPSFLSEIHYLRTLTTYQGINDSVVDILEGQLVCLLIVTAFVLTFLIREWVINQQPPPDLAAVNPAQEANPGLADAALRGPARRRRRRAGEEGREERPRRVAVPRAHRRLAVPETETEGASDTVPRAPDIEQPITNATEMRGTTSVRNEEGDPERQKNHASHQDTSPVIRPTLQPRNALEDAPSIRRTIEEGDSPSSALEWPGLETFKDLWNRADSDPAEVLRIIQAEDRQGELGWVVTQMERLQRRNEQSLQRQTEENLLDTKAAQESNQHINDETIDQILNPHSAQSPEYWSRSDSHSEGPQIFEEESGPPSQRAEESLPDSWDVIEPIETHAETSLQQPTAQFTIDSTLSFPRADNVEESEENLVEREEASTTFDTHGDSDVTPPGTSDNSHHSLTYIEALSDWLWQTEEHASNPNAHVVENDEHMVEDIDQEAPFVPVPIIEHDLDREEEGEPEEDQNPEVVAAAAAAGVDLDNPEAIEDAEDLDGILELIGMQGPLTGMVQNVIFSEFLITLTLAASVWLPYIWGKIALLVLANPFGVFVKAPLHLLSMIADTTVDISLFISGICVYILNSGLDLLIHLLSIVHPASHQWINTRSIGKMSLSLAAGSGTRLEKAIFGTVSGLKPDLPTFSVLSHQALRLFQRQLITDLDTIGQVFVYICYQAPLRLHRGARFHKSTILEAFHLFTALYSHACDQFEKVYQGLSNLRGLKFGVDSPLDTRSLDYTLLRWNTQDRVIAILIGYAFLALAGYLYIKISRLVLGLKNGEKVEGVVADSLNQAGGVTKVILVISIEMIVFPLYCGLLLDVALMPLFEGVGFKSRLAFVMEAPLTAVFVHWFVGTCYMFHFALFVSMCRKIMRRGVLYFIRDPDDPTFHPVRDVLERPIGSQLSKIAFSGLVYGGLVILCLGGIVWVVSQVEGIFPIHWTSNEPILEFPIDLLFSNFLLPILLRSVEPSKKLNAMYEWWFRKCARWLRLTHFLFNEQRDDEQGTHVRRTWSAVIQRKQGNVGEPVIGEDRQILAEDRQLETYFLRDGTFVRAPGSDSVRIPKGGRVFLEVDENNNRPAGHADDDDGPHGRNNEDFVKVYVPPMFRARIAAFVVQVWAFAAVSGIVFAILPLSLGRKSILLITQSNRPPNDLYAFSIGLYICGILAYTFSYYGVCKEWVMGKIKHYFNDTNQALPRLWSSMVYFSGLAYMGLMFGIVLPSLCSALVELYFVTPLHTYFTSTTQRSAYNFAVVPPTIHVIQTWTLGLVYLRVILRTITNQPEPQSRAAIAIRSILRQGFWRPDVRLATRAFILPSIVLSSVLLVAPLGLGWAINVALHEPGVQAKVYRYAYPGILWVALALYCAVLLKRQVGIWRMRIRDDVYLIGERLHNFGEAQRRQNKARGKGKGKARTSDGSVPERLQIR